MSLLLRVSTRFSRQFIFSRSFTDNVGPRFVSGDTPKPVIMFGDKRPIDLTNQTSNDDADESSSTADFLKDPFIKPQVVTMRMYRDLITGLAKSHIPDAGAMRFPVGYFDRIRTFQSDFDLKFNYNEMLLRAMTHKSYALNWVNPAKAKVPGWWKSPAAVETVEKYSEVVTVVSNSSLSVLGQSLLFFLAQSYLFQKYPTISGELLIKESRALVFHPLVASLGSAHFLLLTNQLVLADMRQKEEDITEEIVRNATFALLGAIYLDSGMVALSDFATKHVFPALFRLRDSVEVLQISHVEKLHDAAKSIALVPRYKYDLV